MTSSLSSFWYLLLLELRIFWCYLSFQVMAILCCVAKNSLRGTGGIFMVDELNIEIKWLLLMCSMGRYLRVGLVPVA